jgi:hypothetical protein
MTLFETDLQKTRITLLGTNHGDISGRSRLLYALDILQPDCITIEASSFHVEKFEKRELEVASKGIETCINELIAEFPDIPIHKDLAELLYTTHGYEYFASRDYCRGYRSTGIDKDEITTDKKIPFYCVEDDFEFLKFQNAQEKLTGVMNARHYFALLSSQTIEDYVLQNYFFDGELEPLKIDNSPLLAYLDLVDLIRKRDEKTAQLISRIIEIRNPTNLVHVCGKYHLGKKVQKTPSDYEGLPQYFANENLQIFTIGEIVPLKIQDGELIW